jgi:predicted metal-dependent phosphoesterase TrpH
MAAGRRLGLEIVPGVELSTEHGNSEVHILGYYVNLDHPEFLAHLHKFKLARVERAEKIVHRLRDLDIDLTMSRVLALAGEGTVGRPHIARALVQLGEVTSVAEAFDELLGTGKPAYVPRFKYSPFRAVRLITEAGGVPVLAHPGLNKDDGLIAALVEAGLKGVEVYHPDHSDPVSRHYLALCRQYGLVATGGSDYHGQGLGNLGNLGRVMVHYQVVMDLKALAGC